MIMCVLLCYPISIHMSQVQATGRPISSFLVITRSPCAHDLVLDLFSCYHEIILCARLNTWYNFYFTMSY